MNPAVTFLLTFAVVLALMGTLVSVASAIEDQGRNRTTRKNARARAKADRDLKARRTAWEARIADAELCLLVGTGYVDTDGHTVPRSELHDWITRQIRRLKKAGIDLSHDAATCAQCSLVRDARDSAAEKLNERLEKNAEARSQKNAGTKSPEDVQEKTPGVFAENVAGKTPEPVPEKTSGDDPEKMPESDWAKTWRERAEAYWAKPPEDAAGKTPWEDVSSATPVWDPKRLADSMAENLAMAKDLADSSLYDQWTARLGEETGRQKLAGEQELDDVTGWVFRKCSTVVPHPQHSRPRRPSGRFFCDGLGLEEVPASARKAGYKHLDCEQRNNRSPHDPHPWIGAASNKYWCYGWSL